MCFYGIFQINMLSIFFIPLNRAEAITWENLVPVKKEGSRFAGMKLFACNRRI